MGRQAEKWGIEVLVWINSEWDFCWVSEFFNLGTNILLIYMYKVYILYRHFYIYCIDIFTIFTIYKYINIYIYTHIHIHTDIYRYIQIYTDIYRYKIQIKNLYPFTISSPEAKRSNQ